MIHVFVSPRNAATFDRLFEVRDRLGADIACHRYPTVFRRERVPRGTLIFTDFDLLQSYEIDAAGAMAAAARHADPTTPILNAPGAVAERVALLSRLYRAGQSPIEVTRLDTGDMPSRYPVFLRSEAGCAGPETGLLHDADALRAAMATFAARGQTLTGRIAVHFVAARDSKGFFRKYGAFVVGDRVIPQHILRSADWNVKSKFSAVDLEFVAEEEAYVAENPHAGALLEIARTAGIGFGRVDYSMIDGVPVVYEINTNPTYPRFRGGSPDREGRRRIILERLSAAFAAIDHVASGPPIPFARPANGNRGFIERDPWYLHPVATLSRRRAWQGVLHRLRPGASPKPKFTAPATSDVGDPAP